MADKDIKTSEYSGIATALRDFQATAPVIPKNKTAKIPLKNGGSYEYSYADLADIWDKIRKPLTDSGLSVVQIPTTLQGEHALKTILFHQSGEKIQDIMRLPVARETSPQNLGSAITYAKRYMLSAFLGLVTEDDNDAADLRTASSEQMSRIKRAAYEYGANSQTEFQSLIYMLVDKPPAQILESEVEQLIEDIKQAKVSQEK